MLKKIARLLLFVASGLAVIIVGFFMIRGNMRMWDKTSSEDNSNEKNGKNNGTDDDSDKNNDDGNKNP